MGRTLRIDGVDLSIIEKGSGPPLLLLHGSGSVTEDFAVSGVLDLANAKHRVLAFDRPGFGGSTRPARKRWSACEQADLFHEARRQPRRPQRSRARTFLGRLDCAGDGPQACSLGRRPGVRLGLLLSLTEAGARSCSTTGRTADRFGIPSHLAATRSKARLAIGHAKIFRPGPISNVFSVSTKETAATRSRQLHADHHRSGQPGEGQSACAQPVRRLRHCPPAGSLQQIPIRPTPKRPRTASRGRRVTPAMDPQQSLQGFAAKDRRGACLALTGVLA
nr:alpha/beta fold hydrolase [Mesorhizobium sp. LNHC220B00]